MNKTYKTVWNESAKQWVAVSEVTKGRSKSKNTQKINGAKALAGSVGGVLLALTGASAYAGPATCTLVNGTTTCDTPSATDSYILDVSGPASNTAASHHLVVKNQNINPTALDPASSWRSTVSIGGNNGTEGGNTPQDYGSLRMDVSHSTISNTIQGYSSMSALYMRTDTTGAEAQVNSSAVLNVSRNLNSAPGANDRTEAILVESFNGTSKLHLQATDNTPGATSSNITVTSTAATGSGAGARVHGAQGVDVRTDAGTLITANGDRVYGLAITGVNSAGDLGYIQNGGRIDTHGAGASAINVTAGAGEVELINTGYLTTQGTGAQGVSIVASGDIRGNNTGTIKTDALAGNRAHGMYLLGTNSDIRADNSGNIIATGNDSAGIRIEQNTTSATGNVEVYTAATSYIETNGVQADAIHATIGSETLGAGVASNGNVTVVADGNIKTTGNGSSEGIFAGVTNNAGSTGNISVTFQGDTIETTGTGNNRGIYTRQDGTGDVAIDHFGDSIKTAGNGAHGIFSLINNAGSTGDTRVQVTEDITTKGSGADGVYTQSKGMSGKLEVAFEDGTIDISGSNSAGIRATNQTAASGSTAGIKINTLNAQINVLQDTTVAGATNGYGIAANLNDANASGNITIQNINTAIDVGAGDGSATNSGAILAQIGSTAVTSATGSIRVENTGNLSTQTSATAGSVNVGAVLAASNYGTGGLSVVNTGNLTSTGARANGIHVEINNSASNEKLEVSNSGDITTSGVGARGISAINAGTGLTEILNSGSVYTQSNDAGTSAFAIYAAKTAGGASDGITVVQDGGELKTHSYDGHGIFVTSNATSGDLNVTMRNTAVTLTERNSDGIDVQNNSANSTQSINITTIDGSIDTFDGSIASTAASLANYGIVAIQWNEAQGDITINNLGTRVTTGKNSDGTGLASDAIAAVFQKSGGGTTTAAGNIRVYNEGALTTYDGSSKGIGAAHTGLGNVEITNHGEITTHGKTSYGIFSNIANAASTGTTTIANTADITTAGQNANAIHATTNGTTYTAEAITIVNTGNLSTSDAAAIYAHSGSGNVLVQSTGNITTAQASGATHNHGMNVASLTGKAFVIYDEGTIQVSGSTAGGGNTIGIASWDGGSGNAAQESTITLGSQAIVDASRGVGGLQIRSNGKGEINIASGAQVHGGSSYGIQMQGTGTAAGTYKINNAGIIDAANDRAVLTGGQAGSTLTINNYGTITGYIDSAVTQVIFNNYSSQSLNLRNYYDSDADGIADTKAVAISNFGGGSFNNTATGAVRLLAVSGEAHTDTTGEYLPAGSLSTATQGVVQAQLLNLATFDNAGEIDLSAAGQAGDVLVITGGAVAGTYGAGQYISNGGSLKLDSVLTIKDQGTGAYISQSDILVVDDAKLGSAPTQIHINPVAVTGYQSGVTQNDGIQVVEVLGTSDAGAFTLAAPVTYGAYEYVLGQGTGANAQHWYLRNNVNGRTYFSPDAGAYLGNQHAAATMFNQNILDRRDNILSPDRTLWARTSYSDMSSDLFGGSYDLDIKNTLLQIGADIYKTDSVVAGLYAGYGHSTIDNKSNLTGNTASGKTNGYQIGAYASWMPQGDNNGPYADLWGYYARYDNKLTGVSRQRSDYDSTGYALSAEAGYTYQFAQGANGNAWLIEPHAQITYTRISADDFTDAGGTRFSGNKGSGIQTRLGARLYNQRPAGQNGINPFAEINWLHNNMDNSIRMDGATAQSDIGENVGEVKIGLQGEVNKRLSVWGHVGGQAGSEGYRRYELQLGLGVQW